MVDQSHQEEYISRRLRNFNDSDSEDEEVKDISNLDQSGNISFKDTEGNLTVLKSNMRLRNYASVFQDLVKQTGVVTPYPIISMMITYDSTRTILVTKKNDREYAVLMYDLNSYECTFQEKIGNGTTSYIKLKEVE